MTLSDLSIKRPVFAWMLMSALIIFGAISFSRLGISQMPDVDFPVLEVQVRWDGAAPEIIEAELVDRIEQAVVSVDGVQEVRSSIRQGQGTVTLDFELDRDIDAALQEVQAALSQVHLPLNVEPPVIRKSSTEAEPIIRLGLSGPQPMREMIEYADNFLLDPLQVIPGVGEVSIDGYTDRNLRIWIQNEKLRQYELTILDVQRALEQEHTELAAGYIEDAKREINVRSMGEGMTVGQMENLRITQRGGQPIYDAVIRLKDVARIEDGLADVRRVTRIQGVPGLSIGIKKQRGSNEVRVGRAVKERMEALRKNLPEGMILDVNVDFTQFVEQSVRATEEELLQAGILTALICLLFLGTFSSGFNIMLAIPTSVVGTFMILYFMGFTLNTFTLLALALAIGVVVDDAIMVLENIIRHFRMGKKRYDAARDGAREITFAAVAATVAVIAIFLPVAFMEGVIGRYFFQFGITISSAVALSLLEALTLTPMRMSQFLGQHTKPGRMERVAGGVFERLARGYSALLERLFRVRPWVLAASVLVFAGSLFIGAKLRQEFVPAQDQSLIRIRMETAVGSSMVFTDEKVRKVEAYLSGHPDVLRYFVSVGGNSGFGLVTLVEKSKRTRSQAELMQAFRKDMSTIEGIRLTYFDLSTRGLTSRRSQPVEFNLRGPDYAVLNEKAREIMKRLEDSGQVVDVDNNYRIGMPELRVVPDREAAALRGVTMDSIGRTVLAAIGGIPEGKFTQDGRRYDIRLRLTPEDRLTHKDVGLLQVRNSYGELLPLTDVVKLEESKTLQSINRINRQRTISVTANLATGASQNAALAAAARAAADVLPPGYTFNLEGQSQTFKSSFDSLWFALALGIIVAYMVLASQFNSFVHPFTVLLALPFSVTGAILALWMAGQSINLYSAIGIVLLMGIVKKNSILLVEFANHKREEGLSALDAMRAAAPVRLRPILMTSISTIGAAIPIALGFGAGAETRRPMALAILGGMAISTVLTLMVVPCAYVMLSRLERRRDDAAE
jgi:HAE1 family hydrophobic/amphiphilic exporter-1